MTDNIHFYGAIEKFDSSADGSLMVSGIASTEAVDASGEIVTADAMRKALPSYLQCGTVREMHQPIAAGNPISAYVDDDGRTHFTAHIVDSGTVAKIKANVLKGFSIGGKSLQKVGNRITEILLKDISVVDIPCNPESFFSVIKFDKAEPDDEKKKKADKEKSDKEKSDKEKFMSAELITKVDALTATVESLAKTVETLSKVTPPDLTKFDAAITKISDLEKRANDAQESAISAERNSILQKMDSEGRVVINPETGVAFKSEELQKMDLPMLKFAAKNSPIVPTQARANFRGNGKPKIDPTLKGSDRIVASFAKYDDINALQATPMGSTVN